MGLKSLEEALALRIEEEPQGAREGDLERFCNLPRQGIVQNHEGARRLQGEYQSLCFSCPQVADER